MNYDTISVVAGGWSFSQVPHELVPGYVIAVNDSLLHLGCRVDEVVTMDRMWAEHRIDEILARDRVNAYVRRSAAQHLHEKIHGRPWIHVFECDHESSVMEPAVPDGYIGVSSQMVGCERPYTLNGTNSGMCAINRAYKLARRQVLLFGFDMQFGPRGEKHWYPDYGWPYQPKAGRLREWVPQFRGIARQFAEAGVEIYNVSNRSLIDSFPMLWLDDLRGRSAA